ncbi:thiamine pyrophosphate-requiring protein [Bosea sp. (in: a-proteobacteria)]|uniref:thiamine pyrophosphate-requiring protein n=1 Tax=Bosea sp. (in: a-proteobacteria) TaxID=1871050 RepID=UPI0026333061|nr:thiamine pyrophosphate-requiring protein [Bosea sp. (in: a-proteobacteria)]MCO5091657.1 thiamine pyrophosphate-requiring protein [Bosea sp. (in: a-proteobacteria)]
MNVGQVIAATLKREGVEYIFCYPTNKLIDEAALLGIRPIVVRQERTGLHMADAYSRMSSGDRFGVFAMQYGPGAENAYGAVAQAYAESVPVLVVPMGYSRKMAGVDPNFSSAVSMRDVTKSAEALHDPAAIADVLRRSVSKLKNGRGGPVLIEVPADLWATDVDEPPRHRPIARHRSTADGKDVARAVELIMSAKNPVIYAGQGIHYAKAWPELRELAELIPAPVATTLPGKSAFPEDHVLSLGSGGFSFPEPVKDFLDDADLVIGLGCSFTETLFAVPMPRDPRIIHLTNESDHLNKDIAIELGLVGDAALTIRAIIDLLREKGHQPAGRAELEKRIADARERWLAKWLPHLTSDETPISPYRVIWDLMTATQDENTVITNDAGRPRDQLTPFWVSREPLSFIGWGKTTQLGYGLGLAMGAKLACPDKLCINVWGDAAIGFTGTDFETAAREKIPVLSILLNNGGMATEIKNIPNAVKLYGANVITGNYADMARSLGAYAERIVDPAEIIPAIRRGIAQTKQGKPVLLEFITKQETLVSK